MTEEKKLLLMLQLLKSRDAGFSTDTLPVINENDWGKLIDFATNQKIAPLVYFCLKGTESEREVPVWILQRLQKAYHQNAARNLRFLYELGQVLQRLNEASLPVIVLKGAFLATSVYLNPALRSMLDVDIFMRLEDIAPALEALKGLGYAHMLPPWANVDYHAVLAAPDRIARLEIHWGLTTLNDYYRIPMEELWARSVPVEIDGKQTLSLCPEDLILHLCAHASVKHVFMHGIRALVDIDRCVRHFGQVLDWKQIITRASAWGLGRATALTLYLCKAYLDTPIPETVFEDPRFTGIEPGMVQNALFQLSSNHASIDEHPPGVIRMQGEEKFLAKLRIFLKYVFLVPETPYQNPREMPKLLFAYYLCRRLLFLTAKYSGELLQLTWENLVAGSKPADRKWALLKWLQSNQDPLENDRLQ